jgi:hypothetical protein
MHRFVLSLRILVTVFDDDAGSEWGAADAEALERYLRGVLNERENLVDALGRPAWGRLYFAGELFRQALDLMRGSLGPGRAMFFSAPPGPSANGDQIGVSLESEREGP